VQQRRGATVYSEGESVEKAGLEVFKAFTPAHFATLACVALLVAIPVWTGKQLSNRKPFELTPAWANLVIWAGVHGS
jgi:hypothetical protein